MLIKDNQVVTWLSFEGCGIHLIPVRIVILSIAFLQEDDLYDMKWSPQITVYDQIFS